MTYAHICEPIGITSNKEVIPKFRYRQRDVSFSSCLFLEDMQTPQNQRQKQRVITTRLLMRNENSWDLLVADESRGPPPQFTGLPARRDLKHHDHIASTSSTCMHRLLVSVALQLHLPICIQQTRDSLDIILSPCT